MAIADSTLFAYFSLIVASDLPQSYAVVVGRAGAQAAVHRIERQVKDSAFVACSLHGRSASRFEALVQLKQCLPRSASGSASLIQCDHAAASLSASSMSAFQRHTTKRLGTTSISPEVLKFIEALVQVLQSWLFVSAFPELATLRLHQLLPC